MTISVSDTPIAVVNWDATEDGNVEILLSSIQFLRWTGINLKDAFFTWRDSTDDERRGWQAAHDLFLYEEHGRDLPFFLWDPREIALRDVD